MLPALHAHTSEILLLENLCSCHKNDLSDILVAYLFLQEKLPSRLHQVGQFVEKKIRTGQAADQICRMHDVKRSQLGRQSASIFHCKLYLGPLLG